MVYPSSPGNRTLAKHLNVWKFPERLWSILGEGWKIGIGQIGNQPKFLSKTVSSMGLEPYLIRKLWVVASNTCVSVVPHLERAEQADGIGSRLCLMTPQIPWPIQWSQAHSINSLQFVTVSESDVGSVPTSESNGSSTTLSFPYSSTTWAL